MFGRHLWTILVSRNLSYRSSGKHTLNNKKKWRETAPRFLSYRWINTSNPFDDTVALQNVLKEDKELKKKPQRKRAKKRKSVKRTIAVSPKFHSIRPIMKPIMRIGSREIDFTWERIRVPPERRKVGII